MGWREFFGIRKKDQNRDSGVSTNEAAGPAANATLSELAVGYLLDYDLRTWEVTAHHYYDWGDGGNLTHEWELKCAGDTIHLEKESKDANDWSVSRPISFARLGARVKNYIAENEDPPDEIDFEGTLYHLDEFGGGKFFKDGKGSGREFLIWDYKNENGRRFLSIEQWEEDDFDAFVGVFAKELDFTNILAPKR